VDSAGKKAGKGALIQEEVSATLGVSQDQYLFQPICYSFDSLASNSMKSSNPHSGCREVDVSKTLDTTNQDPSKNQDGIAVVQTYDARGNGDGDIVSTITGDHNGHISDYTSLVVEPLPRNQVIPLEGNGSRPSHRGKGWNESDKMFSLNTTEVHAVAYGVDCRNLTLNDEKYPTLQAKPNGGQSLNYSGAVPHPSSPVINLNKGDVQSKAVLDPSGIAPSLYAG